MSTAAAPAVKPHVTTAEYTNWLSLGRALSLLCDGLRPFLEKEMKAMHANLMASGAPCACVHLPSRKANPYHDMTVCSWATRIQLYHRKTRPNWKQSDSSKWLDPNLGYWEVAKLFMPDIGPNSAMVQGPQDTDITGLLNLMSWCTQFKVQLGLIDTVREVRNSKWVHVAKLRLSDANKGTAFGAIETLLQDPALAGEPSAQQALRDVINLKGVSDLQSEEARVLAEFKDVMNKEKKRSKYHRRFVDDRLNSLEKDVETLKSGFMKQSWKCSLKVLHTFFGTARSLRKNHIAVWFVILVLFLCCSLSDRSSYNDGCPNEEARTPFDTREINLTDYLNTARENFIGRQWLFKELEETFDSASGDVSGVVIVGDPGTGKSALAAQLICSRISSPVIHRHILGYHMCKYSDKNTQNPGKFVRNLAEMIARRIPEYGVMVANDASILRTLERMDCFQDPIGCFEQAVLIPLKKLQNRSPSERWYFVIDGLDECIAPVGEENDTIVDLINHKLPRFPSWLKLVMTTRNDTKIFRHLSSIKIVVFEPDDSRNLEDISLYLTERLYQNDAVKDITHLIAALLNRSQGNFLFVKEVLHYWESSQKAQKDPSFLPKSLADIYHGYFKRLYGFGETFVPVRRILEVLVSTFDPMTPEEIFKVLHWKDRSPPNEYKLKKFKTILKELSHFLRYGINDAVSVYHLSLVDWLTNEENEGPFFISKKKGHELFCDYYFDLIKRNGEMGLRKNIFPLALHIAHTGWKEQYVDEFRNFPSQIVNSTEIGGNKTLLHTAATIDNRDVLRLLLQHFSCIDSEDDRGITPAFLAAKHGLLENLKLLVKRGASINRKTRSVENITMAVVNYKISKAKHLRSRSDLQNLVGTGFDFPVKEDPVLQSKTAFWGSTMLHAAAQNGHSDVVRFLLDKNAVTSTQNGVHFSPLQLAAEGGYVNVVKMLHEAGASVDQFALHHAAANNRFEVVKYLLKNGVKDLCMRCDGSFYWLSGRKRWEDGSMDYFFFKKCESETHEHSDRSNKSRWELVMNDFGEIFDDNHLIRCETALHAAVSSGHEAIVRLLVLEVQSAIDCHDYTGRTPLHEAVRRNNSDIIKLLLNAGANTTKECRFWQTLKGEKSRSKHGKYSYLRVQKQLQYNQDVCHCGYTPLHLAARYGGYHIGKQLLGAYDKARVDHPDCSGATPLHVAACHNHVDFVKFLMKMDTSSGIKSRSYNGSTLLHSAAACGAMDVFIYLLLNFGANNSETDQNGMTPLHYAIRRAQPAENVALTVFWNTSVNDSKPSIHINIDIKTSWVDRFLHLSFYDELNAKDSEGRTALHLAAINGLSDVVNALIKRSVRLDSLDKYGNTALILSVENAIPIAASSGSQYFLSPSFEEFRPELYDHRMVAYLLLSSGASFKKCYRNGSVLHRAIANYQPYIVQGLLLKGASLTCKDHLGRTPLVSWLHNGGPFIDVVLKRFNATVKIKCGRPFNSSLLHLIAYRKPTTEKDTFFERRACEPVGQCRVQDGPLLKIIKTMAGENDDVLNTCLDAEGYSALHRAAQGANAVAIKHLLAQTANVFLPSPSQGLNALWLAVLHRGSNVWWLPPETWTEFPLSDQASESAVELWKHARKSHSFRVTCDSSKAELTLYHAAASRGMVKFVERLLEERSHYGMDVNCPNKDGVTPMYLAKLYGDLLPEGVYNPWGNVVDKIRTYKGRVLNPEHEVAQYITYNHLYSHFPEHLELSLQEHIRHFLVEFVRPLNESVYCEHYRPIHDSSRSFILSDPVRLALKINESIPPFDEERLSSQETLRPMHGSNNHQRCLRHLRDFSRKQDTFKKLYYLISQFKDRQVSKDKLVQRLQNRMHEAVTILYLMWRAETHFKDCLKLWFWSVLSDKHKLRSTFRIYLDVSRQRYAHRIYSLFDQSYKLYYQWVARTDEFHLMLMKKKNPCDFPPDFLVRLTVGEYAHLTYLKILNIGMEPNSRVQVYPDKVRRFIKLSKDEMTTTME